MRIEDSIVVFSPVFNGIASFALPPPLALAYSLDIFVFEPLSSRNTNLSTDSSS
jgi:hypothetical protein